MAQRAVARMEDLRVDASAYKERRDLMVDILKEAVLNLKCQRAASSFFRNRQLKMKQHFACMPPKKYKLLIVPSSGFGMKGHFRLSFSVPIEQIKNSRDIFISLYRDFA